MPGRLPETSDFPSSVQIFITPPPTTSPRCTNVLILLHGVGDTASSFRQLGLQLALPETTCLTVQAPTLLPFDLGGFHWGNTTVVDPGTGEVNPETGFSRALKIVKQDVIEGVLLNKCGYSPPEILFFGLGQGATIALIVTTRLSESFGGIVALGGTLPSSIPPSASSDTPVLILGGSSDSAVTPPAVETLNSVFNTVDHYRWNRSGDGMPRNRDEMLPIMRFLARQLKSRHGIPKGAVQMN